MNRREALKNGALLSTGALFGPKLFADHHEHTFQIGACDWSIKKMLDLDAFHLGKQVGLNGIQYSFGVKGEGTDLRDRKNRDAIRQTVKQTGVAMSSMAIGALNKIPLSNTDHGEELVHECIQTMATLNKEAAQLDDEALAKKIAPNIVLLAFFGNGDIKNKPDLTAKVIEKLKRATPMAEKHGITLGLETWLNEEEHRHIMDSVGSSAVKVYYDVANSNKMGYDIYKEIKSLGSENICEIHCKEVGFLLGRGRIAFERLRGVIKQINYKGWLVIESAVPKGMEIDRAYKHNAAYIRSVFQ